MRRATTAALLVVITLSGGPSVAADVGHVERRKAQADQQTRQSNQRLADLSVELRGAVAALDDVEARLPWAERRLTQVRGTLVRARARRAALDARLTVAVAQRRRTRSEFVATGARVQASSALVGRIARTAYQNGDLSEWAVLLGAQSPRALAGGLAALQSTSQAQGALLARLGQQRADLAASRATLQARTRRIAVLGARQQAVVVQVEALAADALAADTRLRGLAQQRATALSAVRLERRAEQGRYERAAAESRRLAERIAAARRAAERRLARQQARAAARAAARADARARARQPARRPVRASGSGSAPTAGSSFAWPVPGVITTYAGPRTNPVTGQPSCHAGLDIAAADGTPIRAMASGVVIQTANSQWDGYTTVIAHGNGLTTWYAHQSRFGVRSGQRVARGQVVGYVGSTGFSTGPHLHVNIAINEVAYDPLGWFGGSRRVVASMCPGGPSPVL